ncbi:HAD family hydrolase [Candidatus Nitronereus thalassa]|uniref:phosphoglycolate phosphatase n=1 Tax=Candidatus Nitronereus thalassa TaxID=3020898 RepID=A0ABU3K6B7_9BACT|nr:HAD family hydrolase [Candidatus Nitronereus thalassa]MDT7041974.1 HAD family hydrolase [Candidatus Nitronereus thalassa]
MDISKVRAILFDLDGTLYYQPPLRMLMGFELSTLPLTMGSLAKTRSVLEVIKQFRTIREELRHLGNPSECLKEIQYQQASKVVGVKAEEVKRIVEEWMYHRPLKYLKWCRRMGAISFFTEAQRRGIKIGVFSDYPAQEKLEALELESFVQLVLCATDKEINAFKPHPRGFLRACECWGLPPQEVLYVGDRPEVDGKGALAAGMPCMMVGGTFQRPSQGSVSEENISSFRGLQQLLSS